MATPLASLGQHTLSELLDLCRRGVGASTGFMEEQRGDWPSLVAQGSKISRHAVELSALSGTELPALVRYLDGSPDLDFDYISVHGPAKGWTRSSDDLAVELNFALADRVDAVVLHPESLEELAPFNLLGPLLILENMDSLKPTARSVDELLPFFDALPEAGFCFDIAHARMNDRTMMLAHELLDAFGDRLREVHLSSIADDGKHIPLSQGDIEAFWPVLERCGDVPWLLEAPLPQNQKIA